MSIAVWIVIGLVILVACAASSGRTERNRERRAPGGAFRLRVSGKNREECI